MDTHVSCCPCRSGALGTADPAAEPDGVATELPLEAEDAEDEATDVTEVLASVEPEPDVVLLAELQALAARSMAKVQMASGFATYRR